MASRGEARNTSTPRLKASQVAQRLKRSKTSMGCDMAAGRTDGGRPSWVSLGRQSAAQGDDGEIALQAGRVTQGLAQLGGEHLRGVVALLRQSLQQLMRSFHGERVAAQ